MKFIFSPLTTAGGHCRDTAGTLQETAGNCRKLQGRPADYEGDVGEVEDGLPAPDVEEWPKDQRVEDHPHVGGCYHRSPSQLLHKEKLDETSQLIRPLAPNPTSIARL